MPTTDGLQARGAGAAIPWHRDGGIVEDAKVLLACLRQRAQAAYTAGETPFTYRPDPEFAPPPLGEDEELETYRYPHQQFWRA